MSSSDLAIFRICALMNPPLDIIGFMNAKILLYFLLCFFLIGCKQNHTQEKSPYPQYTLSSTDGKEIFITKVKNRLQIVNQDKPILFLFIQPSCTQCFRGIEHLNRLYEDYKDKISFITILLDSQAENFLSEAETLRENYNLSFEFYYCKGEDFSQNFERQTSTNFIALYDKNLHLVAEYEGLVPEEMIELNLNQILKQTEENNV